MVNVYLFSEEGPPTNWTEIGSSYRDRLIKIGDTALRTGGAETHTHTTGSISNISNTSSNTLADDGGRTPEAAYESSHEHSSGSISSYGPSSNNPSYKTLRCHYRSITGWNWKVPAGLIAFCESEPLGWVRFWDGGDKFIRISSTANTEGGGESHSHTISGYFSKALLLDVTWSSGSVRYAQSEHRHSFEVNVTGSAYNYSYWACGLVKADFETPIKKDMYVLFDGDPGYGWEDAGASGKYLRVSSTNSITTGGSYLSLDHTHSKSNAVSGGADETCGPGSGSGSNSSYTSNHTHTFTISLNSATAEPSWVELLLYKATRNMGGERRSVYVITC